MKRPLVTDEPVDRWLSRPLARVVVAVLARTPVTANQLTLVATLFGIGVGVSLWLHEGVVAAGLMVGYLAFDCADGQLARLRGGGGYLGRAMDGLGDYATAVAIHLGLAAWLGQDRGFLYGFAWSAAAGASMAWSSFLLDRYKRRYSGNTDDLEAIRQEAQEAGGLKGWAIATLLPYAQRLDSDHAVPDRERYRERVRPAMILWLLNGPTMHVALMGVLAVWCLPWCYVWVAIGPLNLLTLVTWFVQRHLERRDPAVVA